ncbi:methyl-accepting chemotaxis protein [Massilia consociata]|uniref:Methyl-accepting chemotaxis protein n=1 Tax=Massilia consociata TaxID=760117 RepID=A0ABV6FJ26_9BURK
MGAREGLSAIVGRVLPRRAVAVPAANDTGYGAAIEASCDLDREIGRKLDEAVARTEASALAIMEEVRALCDRSAELAGRLQAASREADQFERDMVDNVAALRQMARFLECLPERLQRDLACISEIAAEIKSLSGLAESVQAISMQSHLLSINAAIEASRAGAAGQAFKVVAEEVRTLAANSNAAASRIGGSLQRIRSTLREGLELNAAQSTDDLAQITQAARTVAALQSSFDQISGSYHARLAEMLAHGEALAAGSAGVLGQLQYQDVVRQCVERLQHAIAQRNAALGQEFASQSAPQPAVLARLIADITAEYLATEQLHGTSLGGQDDAPLIELF